MLHFAHKRVITGDQGGGKPRLSLGGFVKQAIARGVILSVAKDLSPDRTEILRCAQDDTSNLAGSFPKNLPVKGKPRPVALLDRVG